MHDRTPSSSRNSQNPSDGIHPPRQTDSDHPEDTDDEERETAKDQNVVRGDDRPQAIRQQSRAAYD